MIYVKQSSLQVLSERELRLKIFEDFSCIAPANLTNEFLNSYGYTIIYAPQEPTITEYQTLKLSEPFYDNGVIKVVWNIVNKELNFELQKQYIQKLRDIFEEFLRPLKSSYPESEVQGWSVQKEEATNFLKDPNSYTPCLDALAANRQIDKTLLANKIIEKSNEFAYVYGTLIGVRQRYEHLILTANTLEDLPELPKHNTFL